MMNLELVFIEIFDSPAAASGPRGVFGSLEPTQQPKVSLLLAQ